MNTSDAACNFGADACNLHNVNIDTGEGHPSAQSRHREQAYRLVSSAHAGSLILCALFDPDDLSTHAILERMVQSDWFGCNFVMFQEVFRGTMNAFHPSAVFTLPPVEFQLVPCIHLSHLTMPEAAFAL